jgi:hypothetical protein
MQWRIQFAVTRKTLTLTTEKAIRDQSSLEEHEPRVFEARRSWRSADQVSVSITWPHRSFSGWRILEIRAHSPRTPKRDRWDSRHPNPDTPMVSMRFPFTLVSIDTAVQFDSDLRPDPDEFEGREEEIVPDVGTSARRFRSQSR